MTFARVSAGLALLLLSAFEGAASATPQRYAIDPASSRLMIHVGKAGIFRFAGHEHEVAAPVEHGVGVVDPDRIEASSVELTFDAKALRVTGRGEPSNDVPKVQAAMVGPTCLDAARFPTIRFVSSSVSSKGAASGTFDVVLRGTLTLHGVSRALDVPVHLIVGRDSLSASGSASLRQSDFGITPISVGGAVKVKDELLVEWHLVGRRAP